MRLLVRDIIGPDWQRLLGTPEFAARQDAALRSGKMRVGDELLAAPGELRQSGPAEGRDDDDEDDDAARVSIRDVGQPSDGTKVIDMSNPRTGSFVREDRDRDKAADAAMPVTVVDGKEVIDMSAPYGEFHRHHSQPAGAR